MILLLLLLILTGNPNLFLDLKQYHSLEHAETNKYIFFYLDIYFVKENEWSGFYNFLFGAKYGFELEKIKI